MTKTRWLVLIVFAIAGCSKARGYMQESLNILYEVHDNLAKINDEDAAKRFLDGDAKKIEDRAKNLEKRLQDYRTSMDSDDKKDQMETIRLPIVSNEMMNAVKMIAHQIRRLTAVQARMQAEGRDAASLRTICGSAFLRIYMAGHTPVEDAFKKQ